MAKYLVKAYGTKMQFDTREAAEMFLENNACAAEKVDGQYIRELVSA